VFLIGGSPLRLRAPSPLLLLPISPPPDVTVAPRQEKTGAKMAPVFSKWWS